MTKCSPLNIYIKYLASICRRCRVVTAIYCGSILGYEGIIPQNLQEHIRMPIVRLSAECYSQRQVYRILVVSQGCISKLLQRNLDSCRPYQRRHGGPKSLTTVQEDRQLIWMARDNNFILAPRLHVEMIRWFRRSLTVRRIVNMSLATSCWCRDPTRFPGWRWITGNAVVCGGNAQIVGPQAHEALCL